MPIIIMKIRWYNKSMNYVVLIFILFFLYLIFEISIYKIEKIELFSNKIKNEIRIIQISDYHLNSFINLKKLKKDVEKFNPDFVFLTGDIIKRDTAKFELLEDFLCLFKEYSTYFVDGNHECENKKVSELYELLYKFNIVNLSDKDIFLSYKNNNISLYGKSFYSKYKDNCLDEKNYNIFLVHNPNDFLNYKREYDLVLSGHKHGGQVRIPILGQFIDHGPVLFPKYSKGIYNIENTKLYIDSGLGQSFNFRFMCRVSFTEIVIRGYK